MPDPTNFEARLADVMRRYANRAPTDVDAVALAAEIASASTTETHRRPRWWRVARTHHEQGRSRTMFMATGTGIAAIAGLVLALSVGSLLPDGSDPAPPGAEAPVIGDDWAFFSGTLQLAGSSVPGDEPYEADGMVIEEGAGFSKQLMRASDPRFTGTSSNLMNIWLHESEEDGEQGIAAAIRTIVNGDGEWTCETTLMWIDSSHESGWCTGEGAYDGQQAYLYIGDPGDSTTAPLYGYVTADDLPQQPEPGSE